VVRAGNSHMTDTASPDPIASLTDLVHSLQTEVTSLKSELAATRAESTPDVEDAPTLFNRRLLLKGAGLAAAGAAAAAVTTVAGATPAAAGGIAMTTETTNLAAASTGLRYTGSQSLGAILLVQDALYNETSYPYPAAVQGLAAGTKAANGLFGFSQVGGSAGVVGFAASQAADGVLGRSQGSGAGVHGLGTDNTRAMIAESTGTQQALWAKITSNTNTRDSIRSETAGSGSGIYASSVNGAGGKFQGKTAQVVMVPSTASSHPASGTAGALFVDSSKRLWFCKGGSNWQQIA